MKPLHAILLSLLLTLVTACSPPAERAVGDWHGTMTTPQGDLTVAVRISTSGDNTTIKFDAPDAGANNLGVAGFSRSGNKIHFEVPITGAKFDGVLSADGNSMAGSWFFPGLPTLQVTFVRGATNAQQ